MKYLYPYFLFCSVLLLIGCSGGSNPDSTINAFEGEPNSSAIETCYDVQITNASNVNNKIICTTLENSGYNGLGAARFMRFTVNSPATVSIRATRVSGLNPADPDIILYRNGVVMRRANTFNFNSEILTINLSAGNYVAEVNEYSYLENDEKSSLNFQVQQKSQINNVSQSTSPPSNCATGNDSNVSGNVTFSRVNNSGSALNYNNITYPPVQQAVVEVLCNNGVYSSSTTNSNGDYLLNFPNNENAFVRVKAQMLNAGNWDFSVVDNATSGQPVYVMDGSVFNDNRNIIRNLRAGVGGWDNFNYTETRVAAPFAILDSVRKAKEKILSVASVSFPALKINWSPDNSAANNTGTFYNGSEIFLSGRENVDTDEYDEHVIIHEWAHYFEDKFSRSDSIGGIHGLADILDIRVAFGEGFGNAFSAMVLDDPYYVDTSGLQQSQAFSINMDNNNCINAGWHSECSVQSILYDIYDATNEGGDTLNMNFSFIYNVLIGEQKNTQALTSIFSFIKSLKDQNVANANAIDALLGAQNIDSVSDVYGSSQITSNPGQTNQLPIYEAY